jgi:cytidine deaminase
MKKKSVSAADSKMQKWHKLACEVRGRAYAPYSKYHVGSAIVLTTGEVFTGCNVENASYGGTNCAERTAIFKAISEKGKIKITDVVVVVDEKEAWPPCGLCRQVISEFAIPGKTKVHFGNLDGIQRTLKFTDLMPFVFDKKHLS